MSTVPQITAGRDGSALHSRLSANCPRSVLIATGFDSGFALLSRSVADKSIKIGRSGARP